MSQLNNKLGDSSTASETPYERPTSRTRYKKDPVVDLNSELVSLYKVGNEVYLNGTRGTDPVPFKIHKELGDGQYQIERDGKVELAEDGKTPKVVLEENLQLGP